MPAGASGSQPRDRWFLPASPTPLSGRSRGAKGTGATFSAALAAGNDVNLGVMPLADLTRFIAFQLTDTASDARLLFSVGLPMEGVPAERHSAIFRSIIINRDAFFRYLRLLLSELGDPFAARRLRLKRLPGKAPGGEGEAMTCPCLKTWFAPSAQGMAD